MQQINNQPNYQPKSYSTLSKCLQTSQQFGVILNKILTTNQAIDKLPVRKICEADKQKILNLFNYNKWNLFMKWIDDKLLESGEDINAIMQGTQPQSSIISELKFSQASSKRQKYIETSKGNDKQRISQQYHLLLKEHFRLKQQNSKLRKKLEEIQK